MYTAAPKVTKHSSGCVT